jgi:hypothetical protein
MKKSTKAKTKRGQPATSGRDPFRGIWLPAKLTTSVDARAENVAAKSRSEAICRLVEIGLRAKKLRKG